MLIGHLWSTLGSWKESNGSLIISYCIILRWWRASQGNSLLASGKMKMWMGFVLSMPYLKAWSSSPCRYNNIQTDSHRSFYHLDPCGFLGLLGYVSFSSSSLANPYPCLSEPDLLSEPNCSWCFWFFLLLVWKVLVWENGKEKDIGKNWKMRTNVTGGQKAARINSAFLNLRLFEGWGQSRRYTKPIKCSNRNQYWNDSNVSIGLMNREF